jgi:hypothetical protein
MPPYGCALPCMEQQRWRCMFALCRVGMVRTNQSQHAVPPGTCSRRACTICRAKTRRHLDHRSHRDRLRILQYHGLRIRRSRGRPVPCRWRMQDWYTTKRSYRNDGPRHGLECGLDQHLRVATPTGYFIVPHPTIELHAGN